MRFPPALIVIPKSETTTMPSIRAQNRVLRRCRPVLSLLLALAAVIALPAGVAAQDLARDYYWAIEGLETGEAVQRGRSGPEGFPPGSVLLASSTRYRLWKYHASGQRIARVTFSSPAAAASKFTIPESFFVPVEGIDSDRDGLTDEAEWIIGTDPVLADTDNDGVDDAAEIAAGTNPDDGIILESGVILNRRFAGSTVWRVDAFNNMIYVAHGEAGISGYNIFNAMEALLLVQVDTPGQAVGVAYRGGNRVAVADGDAGLAIIDTTQPPSSFIAHQVPAAALGGERIHAVAIYGDFALTASDMGVLAVTELASGRVLQRLRFAQGAFQTRFAISGEVIYVLSGNDLMLLRFQDDLLRVLSTPPVSQSPSLGVLRDRVYVGGGAIVAWDTGDPYNPRLDPGVRGDNAVGFGPLALTSGGKLLANLPVQGGVAVFNQPAAQGEDLEFINILPTTGSISDLTVYNGLAYSAGWQGADGVLEVLNFQNPDRGGLAPTGVLASSIGAGESPWAGTQAVFSADVSDDIDVRNVEFFRNGARIATDGNPPFQIVLPLPSGPMEISAVARDLSANRFDLAPVSVTAQELPTYTGMVVFPDQTPVGGARVTSIGLRAETVTDAAGRFELRAAPGAIEIVLPRQNPAYALVLTGLDPEPGSTVDLGKITLQVLADVYAGDATDADLDGVPDELEPGLGLDPTVADSAVPGVPDGLADPDFDGLSIVAEIFLGSNPGVRDSDGDGLADGRELLVLRSSPNSSDTDRDSLADNDEFLLGTDPNNPDTDGDLASDEAEVTAGTDPLDRADHPYVQAYATGAAAFRSQAVTPSSRHAYATGVSVFRSQAVTPSSRDAYAAGVSVFRSDPVVPGAGAASASSSNPVEVDRE